MKNYVFKNATFHTQVRCKQLPKKIMGNETYLDKKGYKRFCNSNKLVHRWAAEKKLGRKLKKGEVVHHKDRNKTNNNPNNLHVFKNQKQHDYFHRKDAIKHGPKASYKGFDKNENPGCFVSLFYISIIIYSSLKILS